MPRSDILICHIYINNFMENMHGFDFCHRAGDRADGSNSTISTAVGALQLGPDVTCEIQAGGNMKKCVRKWRVNLAPTLRYPPRNNKALCFGLINHWFPLNKAALNPYL